MEEWSLGKFLIIEKLSFYRFRLYLKFLRDENF